MGFCPYPQSEPGPGGCRWGNGEIRAFVPVRWGGILFLCHVGMQLHMWKLKSWFETRITERQIMSGRRTAGWLKNLFEMAIVVAALTGCAAEGGHGAIVTDQLEPYSCGSITRLHTYKGVFLASQPSPDDFGQAQKGGVQTVINLRHADEIKDFDEQQVVTGLGLKYENPAWNGVDELTDDVFNRVRHLLKTSDRPILLHCGSGNRVGAMWLAYRVLDEGLNQDEAVAEAKVVGLKSPDYEARAKAYIEQVRQQSGG